MGTLTMSTNRDDNFSILILKLSCQFMIQSDIYLNRPSSNLFGNCASKQQIFYILLLWIYGEQQTL